MKSKKFILNYSEVEKLCRCCSVINDKNAILCLSCFEELLFVFVSDYSSTIEFRKTVSAGMEFNVGVNLQKFLNICKKVYDGDIQFELKSNKVFIKQGNMVAKLPVTNSIDFPANVVGFKDIGKDRISWLIDSLSVCSESVLDQDKFVGILIDQKDEYIRVAKLSSSCVTIVSGNERIIDENKRYVIHSDLVKVLKSVKGEIEGIYFSDNVVGISLGNVFIKGSLLNDSFPADYIEALGLSLGSSLVDEGRFIKYSFNRDELFSVIDTSMVVSDNKKASFISFEFSGTEKDTGLVVWNITCKSYDGSVVEDKVKCCELLNKEAGSNFIVNGKDLINSLRVRGEKIYLYDSDASSVIVADSDMLGVTMLVKSTSL